MHICKTNRRPFVFLFVMKLKWTISFRFEFVRHLWKLNLNQLSVRGTKRSIFPQKNLYYVNDVARSVNVHKFHPSKNSNRKTKKAVENSQKMIDISSIAIILNIFA